MHEIQHSKLAICIPDEMPSVRDTQINNRRINYLSSRKDSLHSHAENEEKRNHTDKWRRGPNKEQDRKRPWLNIDNINVFV